MKLLLIQLKRAGDVLVTTPVIEALKQRFPDAQIDFLTEKAFAPLLKHHPLLTHVQIYDKTRKIETILRIRGKRYDAVIDFQSSPRSALLVLFSGAKIRAGYQVTFWGFVYNQRIARPSGSQSVTEGKFSLLEFLYGPLGPRPERKIVLAEEEKKWAEQAMSVGSARRVVGLIPPHRHESRRWPDASFAQLARELLAAGHAVWLFWGPGEEDLVKSVAQRAPGSVLIPNASFRQMAALLARCSLVITNDSGPMHLATAVGTPTITIYGPTDPANWNPGGPKHKVLQALDVPCLKCNLNVCPINHECMTHLTPEQVFAASRAVLV